MGKKFRKNGNHGSNRNNGRKRSYKSHVQEVSNLDSEILSQNHEKNEIETPVSYSEMATNVIKTGTISTLKTISYLADAGITVTDKLTSDTIPAYLKISSVSTSVISGVLSYVPAEAANVISMATPLMTLGNDIRSLDPTGLADVYMMYNQTQTFLSCTRMAANFAISAIEKGSVKEAAIANAQSVADKYIPSNVKNLIGSVFGRW